MRNRPANRGRRAFSLMELLVVVGIIAILLVLIVPSSRSLLSASHLSSATNMVRDEMSVARQTALSRNREVEIRIYRLPAGNAPDQLEYRALRSYLAGARASDPPEALSPLRRFREPVVISPDPRFSSLLDVGNTSRSGLSQGTEELPTGDTPYIAFKFRPNGETALRPVSLPEGNWFLTLHAAHSPVNTTTGLPDNYSTIQVDPVTGRIRTYRP